MFELEELISSSKLGGVEPCGMIHLFVVMISLVAYTITIVHLYVSRLVKGGLMENCVGVVYHWCVVHDRLTTVGD